MHAHTLIALTFFACSLYGINAASLVCLLFSYNVLLHNIDMFQRLSHNPHDPGMAGSTITSPVSTFNL